MTRQAVTPADLLGHTDMLNLVWSKVRPARLLPCPVDHSGDRGSTGRSPIGSPASRPTVRAARRASSPIGAASTRRTSSG